MSVDVEDEKMKMAYIEFSSECTEMEKHYKKYSCVRGESLEKCLEFTKKLHKMQDEKPDKELYAFQNTHH